jgi:hypothetical protein
MRKHLDCPLQLFGPLDIAHSDLFGIWLNARPP